MKKITYQPKQVRLFLLLLLLFLFLLIWRLTRASAWSERLPVLAGAAAAIAVLLLVPRLFFPVFRAIVIGSSYVGSFIFSVLAVLVFYLILTPIALVMRLAGRKFLQPGPDPSLASYFEESETETDVSKQF